MQKLSRSAVLALACVSVAASVTHAQARRIDVGPRATYNFDAEKSALGAQLGIPLASIVDFYPSFEWFLVNGGSLVALNADLKLYPTPVTLRPLYFGAGLNLLRDGRGGSNTNANFNLFGGLESRTGAVHPFAELRAIIGDGSTVQVSVGVNFTMGSRDAVAR